MESYSPESDPATYFGFDDLHGFKDFVGYVFLSAPNSFFPDDWRPADQQMNLQRALIGLRYGLSVATKEKGDLPVLSQCARIVDEAENAFHRGDSLAGCRKLRELDGQLATIPSR